MVVTPECEHAQCFPNCALGGSEWVSPKFARLLCAKET